MPTNPIDLTPLQAAFKRFTAMQERLREQGVHATIHVGIDAISISWTGDHGPVLLSHNVVENTHYFRTTAVLKEAV